MKLIKIKQQHRRDFIGIYKCESCNTSREISGYDDDNFHINVAPNIKCKKCGKSTNDLGIEVQKIKTKYKADEVI